jgi:hypothetical protein
MRRRGRCYIHIGTHKTGTTTLQTFFARNAAWLGRRGVHYPSAGRTQHGHHNLAWELYGDARFSAAFGTLAALREELARCRKPVVAISSEDLCLLHDLPDAIARLAATIAGAGYEPYFVLDVRPQVDYVEALYATYALLAGRHRDFMHFVRRSFDDFANEGFATGQITSCRPALLTYDRLADTFSAAVGRDRVIVRAYRAGAAPGALVESWLAQIAVPLDGSSRRRIRATKMEGGRPSFAAILHALGVPLSDRAANLSTVGEARFHAFELSEIKNWERRFGESNDRLARTFGVRIGVVSDARRADAMTDSDDPQRRAVQCLREEVRQWRTPPAHVIPILSRDRDSAPSM